MLLVASCIYVCFMSACILHLRRCHVWLLGSFSFSFSSFSIYPTHSAAFRLFPFSHSSPRPPSYSARPAPRRCLHFLTFLKPVSHLVVSESLNSKEKKGEKRGWGTGRRGKGERKKKRKKEEEEENGRENGPRGFVGGERKNKRWREGRKETRDVDVPRRDSERPRARAPLR